MKNTLYRRISLGLVGLLLVMSTPAMAEDNEHPPSALMVLDIPLRVISLGVTVAGVAVFVVALPFVAFGPEGSVGTTWDGLVQEPLEFSFTRPLGKFDDWRHSEPEK